MFDLGKDATEIGMDLVDKLGSKEIDKLKLALGISKMVTDVTKAGVDSLEMNRRLNDLEKQLDQKLDLTDFGQVKDSQLKLDAAFNDFKK